MKYKEYSLSLIIMAAGVSKRYGSENKLLDSIDGKRLIDIVIDIIPKNLFDSVVAVTSDDDVSKAFKSNKIQTINNPDPNRGVGSTIKLGLSSVGDAYDGYMFLVCDQPFLSKQTITELIEFWHSNASNICALAYDKKMGNPVIFPKSLFDQLCDLTDAQNGKVVIDNNRNLLKTYQIKDKRELFDIDTIQDSEHANKLKNNL